MVQQNEQQQQQKIDTKIYFLKYNKDIKLAAKCVYFNFY